MKKLISILTVFILLTAGAAWAFVPKIWVLKSGEKTADTAILSSAGYFSGIVVETDGTNTCTVVLYDNTAGSGTKIAPDWIVQTSSTNKYATLGFDPMVAIDNGIYVDITTAGTCTFEVYYRAQ